MAQNYSYLITKELINIPNDFPHFIVNGVITIPIDVEKYSVFEFIECYELGELKPLEFEDEGYEEFEGEDLGYEENPEDILDIVKTLGLEYKEFAVMHTSDWAGIPDCEFNGAFKLGKLVAKHIDDDRGNHEGSYLDIFNCLGIDEGSVLIFHSYGNAKQQFKRNNAATNGNEDLLVNTSKNHIGETVNSQKFGSKAKMNEDTSDAIGNTSLWSKLKFYLGKVHKTLFLHFF